MDTELLKALCDAPGIPGREQQVRALAAKAMKPLVDQLYVDDFGNLIGVKKGQGPKVMLSGHMDEIGFMVNHIDDKGFLRVVDAGGIRLSVLAGQRVIVHGKEVLPGVMSREGGWRRARGLDEEKNPARIEEFYVDIGIPKEQAEALVKIGDQVTMAVETIEMGNTVCGKAMDDRVGLFVMIEALRKLGSHEAEIYAVGSVQEEVGCRGAKVSAYRLDPDVAIALDVCPAQDIPGVKAHEHVTTLGKGAAIAVRDHGTIGDRKLVRFLEQIADEQNIPYQLQVTSRGGTDARDISQARAGTPATSISIPCRYVHTSLEVVHKDDVEASSNLLTCFLERAHDSKYGESEQVL